MRKNCCVNQTDSVFSEKKDWPIDKRAGIRYDERRPDFAGMAELADAPDLGSGGRPCRFESCCPHEEREPEFLNNQGFRFFFCFLGAHQIFLGKGGL